MWTRRATLGAILVAAAIGCNAILGIEDKERPLRGSAPKDAAPDAPEAPVVTSGCFEDSDCPALDPCLGGRCDRSRQRCVYTTCQPNACALGECQSPRMCSQSSIPLSTIAATFSVPNVTLGCGEVAGRCFTTIYPFAFVGTSVGVIAVPLDAFGIIEPARVPIELPFVPARIVGTKTHVYFIGTPANGTLRVASLDVPVDPRVTKLTAKTATLVYPFETALASAIAGTDEILVYYDSAALGYPAARLGPDFNGGAAIVHVPIAQDAATPRSFIDGGSSMFGATNIDLDGGIEHAVGAGDRIVLVRLGPFGTNPRAAAFSVIEKAGTPNAEAARGFATMRGASSQNYADGGRIVTGPDGTTYYANIHFSVPAVGLTRAQTFVNWVLAPGATLVDGIDYTTLDYLDTADDLDAGPDAEADAAPAPVRVYRGIPAPLPIPLDGERLVVVTTNEPSSDAGVGIHAVRRANTAATPLFGMLTLVGSEKDGALSNTNVAGMETGGFGVLYRQLGTGGRILVIDPRCAPIK